MGRKNMVNANDVEQNQTRKMGAGYLQKISLKENEKTINVKGTSKIKNNKIEK